MSVAHLDLEPALRAPAAFAGAPQRSTRGTPIGQRDVVEPRIVAAFLRVPSFLLLGAIRGYQRFLSPLLPVVTLGACACRFAPTCSEYAADAVRTHGAIVGAWLAARRLLRCTPLHAGGFDPVPPRRIPVCRRGNR